MTDVRDFETELHAALVEVEAAAVPPAGLAQRLVANATEGRGAEVQRDFRARRWLPPLLAAAAVVAVVAVGAAVVDTTSADRRSPATQPPPATSTSTSPLPRSSASVPAPSSPPAVKPSTQPTVPPGTAVPAGFVAASVSFRDANDGYAIGNVPCSAQSGYCATLVRTTDGGVSWLQIPLPTGLTPVDDKGSQSGGSCGTNGGYNGPCVDRVVFADATHGFVYSVNQLYSTIDGGRTWRSVAAQDGSPTHVWQLVVAGNDVVRLGPLHECSAGCAAPVYRAAIGSSTWTASNPPGGTPNVSSVLKVVGPNIYLLARGLSGQGSAAVLYRSADGGASWQFVDKGCQGVLVAARNTVRCDTSGSTQWETAGSISYRLSADGASVQVSTDGGATSTPHAF